MRPNRPKTVPKRLLTQKNKPVIKDPIEVFCRIRPLLNSNDVVCIRAKDEKTVVMAPPDGAFRGAFKEVHYSFQYVFDETTSQKGLFDHVTLPLVKDLLQGTNALLFTYGITSSGKTYTMAGTPHDPGILPRSLDVIFNSLEGFQAQKYVFKPDRLNGFEIQSTSEALQDLQKETTNKPKGRRRDMIEEWSSRVREETVVDEVNSDYSFAMFVSYVEIYNNYIYDLLEEWPSETYSRPRIPQSKMLREDSSRNMYVFGTTEIEVKSANEALELFSKGQQKRRISHTALNAESSRSHSVFTIRIVQAPLDIRGGEVLQDRSLLTVSQLSMVDLAGSERSVRTRNTGHKLRETGNINASLMALRTCIEVLRENQAQGGTKMVPYRESKLTHLFKTFFEGEGKIRMVVCVNPRAEDFDETTHVMRFAEMTQDVMISRATPVSTPVNLGLRAGRGNLFREAVLKHKEDGIPLEELLPPLMFSLGPEFPPLKFEGPDDEETIENLIEFLNARATRRSHLIQELNKKQDDFRQNLMKIDKENISLKQERIILQMDLKAREQQVRDLERKLSHSEETLHLLRQKFTTLERQSDGLKSQLNQKTAEINAGDREMQRLRSRMQDKIQLEKDRMRRIMEKRLAEKQAELERKMCFNEEKFRQLREILNSGDWECGADFAGWMNGPTSTPNLPEAIPVEGRMMRSKTTLETVPKSTAVQFQTKAKSEPRVDQVELAKQVEATTSGTPQKSVAVANPRHRRSQSSSGNVWLEHKPVGNLDLGTVLQPKMKKKISVSKLEVKDVVQSDVSKYVLTHQEQDSNGEVETQLYKADVIPSAGGGAQVIFNDIEKLKQESPPNTSGYQFRKRSAENVPSHKIEKKCAVAVECHGVPSKVRKRSK